MALYYNPDPLGALAQAFDAALEEDLLRILLEADHDTLWERLDGLRDLIGQVPLPKNAPGEISVYLPSDSENPYFDGGFPARPSKLQSATHKWGLIDAIKHRLLYCHRVVIDDPTTMSIAVSAGKSINHDRAGVQELLTNLVSLLRHLQPVIKSGALILGRGPNHSVMWQDLHGAQKRLQSALQPSDFRPAADMGEVVDYAASLPFETHLNLEKSLAAGNDLLSRALMGLTVPRLSRAVAAMTDARDELTPYLPFKHDSRLLQAIADRLIETDEALAPIAPGVQNHADRMRDFFRLELPGLTDLSSEDVAAIRDDDAFADWHKTLRTALDQAARYDLSGHGPELADLAAELQTSKSVIDAQLSKSPTLSAARYGAVGFVGGMASAALPAILAGPVSWAALGLMAAGAGAGAAVGIAADVFKRDPDRGTAKLLNSHYVSILG